MTLEITNKLEERLSILEFKLEIILKLAKLDMNLTLETCKTMVELAFVMELKKSDFNAINELLTTQIKFYQDYKHKSYSSPRQLPRLEKDLDVFQALSPEEFEHAVWTCVPKLEGNKAICEKIAKLNGIHEMYYDLLAEEIKKTKFERLDREEKLLISYKENKAQVDDIFKEINILKQELQSNVEYVDSIIKFFNKNELIKISVFYNGELWDRDNDDKQVVVSPESYIHNVCKFNNREVLTTISEILKDKKHPYSDLLSHLLNSGPTSSKTIETLQVFYKSMEDYNKNEYVLLVDLNSLKANLESNIVLVDETLNSYQNYINSL